MSGGEGYHFYVVDNLRDTVQDDGTGASEGIISTISYRFSEDSDVKDLFLAFGTFTTELWSARNAIGNSGDNTITGNRFDNVLQGRGSSDWLYGDAGNDLLLGGDGDDQPFQGGDGRDTVRGQDGADILWGDVARISSSAAEAPTPSLTNMPPTSTLVTLTRSGAVTKRWRFRELGQMRATGSDFRTDLVSTKTLSYFVLFRSTCLRRYRRGAHLSG